MGLNLFCEICGRSEVGGLLSGAAWGRVEDEGPTACPDCVQKHSDWRDQLAVAAKGRGEA